MNAPAPHAALTLTAMLIAGLVQSAHAQYVLDANLSASGRYNPRVPSSVSPAMNRPIYSVNQATGTMVYNRANAYNDSTYSIYQRYTIDRFGGEPAGLSTAAALELPRGAPPTLTPANEYTAVAPSQRPTTVSSWNYARPNPFPTPSRKPPEPTPFTHPAYSTIARPASNPEATHQSPTYSIFSNPR